MYEIVFPGTGEVAPGLRDEQKTRQSRGPAEMLRPRHANESQPTNRRGFDARNRGTGPEAKRHETRPGNLPDTARDTENPSLLPLPNMAYDDSLTSPDACVRLWISAVLIDKQRGDRLTAGDKHILSLIGLDPSWVQRMIDKAPSGGRALRVGFI